MKKSLVVIALFLLLVVIIIGRRTELRKNHLRQPSPSSSSLPRINDSYQSPSDGDRKVKAITTVVDNIGGRVDWCHANDLIAFSKKETDGYADLYTMKADGSSQVCLTCGKTGIPQKHNDQPAWHPSGDYIIFQSQDPNLELPATLKGLEDHLTQGGAGINNNLWITTPNGDRFYQLTHVQNMEGVLHPHFSHNGKKLLWAERSLEGKKIGAKWMLKVADFTVDASGVPHLENVTSYRPQGENDTFYESHGFTLDDAEVIFSSSIGRDHQLDMDIWKMDLSSGKLTQLTNTENEWDEHAQLSPDGKKIVWISSHGNEWDPSKNYRGLMTDYWMMNIDGSEKERLTYFNERGHDEFVGPLKKAICADSSWNKAGDKIVAVQSVGRDGSRIVMIELKQ